MVRLEQFLFRPLEHVLGFGVGVKDATPLVHFESGVRRGLEKQ